MRRGLAILCAAAIACGSARADALEDDPAVVGRIRAALAALVDETGAFIAVAARIHGDGIYIVPAAAVRGPAADSPMRMAYRDGSGRTTTAPARIVRQRPDGRFVLLRVETERNRPALRPAATVALAEKVPVPVLVCERHPPHEIRVVPARVESVRTVGGVADRLRLDGPQQPGAAVADLRGMLLGFVRPDGPGQRSDEVVIVTNAAPELVEPLVLFAPSPLAPAEAGRPADFRIEVVFPDGATVQPEVELALDGPAGRRRFTAAPVGRGTYAVRAVPLPQRGGPPRLRVTIVYPDGSIHCAVEDRAVSVNGRPMSLGRIGRITRDEGRVAVVRADGHEIPATAVEVPALRADLGGYMLEVDAFRAKEIIIHGPEQPPRHIDYAITVSAGGRALTCQRGTIPLATAGAATRPAAGLPPTMPATAPATGRPVAARADLEVHIVPAGAKPGEGAAGEFNVPRAEVRIPAAGSRRGGIGPAVRVRIINRGGRTISALKASVVCSLPDATIRSDVIDVAAACGALRPGDAAALYVELPAEAPPDLSGARLAVEIIAD